MTVVQCSWESGGDTGRGLRRATCNWSMITGMHTRIVRVDAQYYTHQSECAWPLLVGHWVGEVLGSVLFTSGCTDI